MVKSRVILWIFFAVSCFLISCSSTMDIKREVTIPKDVYDVKAEEPVVKEPLMPDFVPSSEDVSPLKTRSVDVDARNTPLRDVLYVIAEATGLNLVMEKGVVPETPVTMTLRDVSAEDALNTIFSSVDYFYTITNNMLVVKALDTKIFELGRPAVINTYNVNIGGDIIGGALANATPTGTGGTSGSSNSSNSGNLTGSITQSSKNDAVAFGFWDAIERSLAVILGIPAAQTVAAPAVAAPVVPGQPEPQAPSRQTFTINRMTGTIIVTASKQNLDRVERYLNAIKQIINKQVLIEAKIIEVQLSNGLQYGIDWTQAVKNLKGVGPLSFGPQGFASSAVGSSSPSFNFNVTSSNFTALLKALQLQGEVRTLSNPRVNIMNGQTALLSVGTSTAFISNVTTTNNGSTTAPLLTTSGTTSSVLSGISIGLVPFINENGEVLLTITPIVSNLVTLTPATLGSQGGGTNTISLPTVDLREMSTTVKVRDGQMVIIGGLISKSESLQDNKVPGLGDLPVAGSLLFTSRNKAESKTELVVVLQPTIISK